MNKLNELPHELYCDKNTVDEDGNNCTMIAAIYGYLNTYP